MLYMRRDGDDKLSLSVEHRAAPSQSGIPLALTGDDDALALEIREHISNAPTKPSHTETVREILAAQTSPMSLIALRQACGIRTATLCEVLKSLISENRVLRTEHGYVSSPV